MTWARRGTPCICIDQEWRDTADGAEVIGPELHDFCIVDRVEHVDGECWVRVVGYSTFFALIGFRPLTHMEVDMMLFSSILEEVRGGVLEVV